MYDSDPNSDSVWKWLTGKWATAVGVIILLVVAFYLEEDWRGRAAWNQAQVEVAAAGERLDPAYFIPPPVPDAQNFGALPIFATEIETDPTWGRSVAATGMKQAFARINADNMPYQPQDNKYNTDQLPYLGNWARGETPDVAAIQRRMAELCHRHLPNEQLAATAAPVDMFELLCPALGDLRSAELIRPTCRFNDDYTSQPTFARGWGGVTSGLKLAKVLAYEEELALLDKRPELVMADLKVGWKVDSGLRKEPFLISGLVSMGVQAIQLQIVRQGLTQHIWNQRQLAEMDHDLGAIDDLAEAQFCIRGEAAVMAVPTSDYLKKHRLRIRDVILGLPPAKASANPIADFLASTLAVLIPDGWFDQIKAESVRFNLLGAVKEDDPKARRVFPEQEEKALSLIEDPKTSGLWDTFVKQSITSGMSAMKRFAYTQVQIDEARIACQLEMYRLQHGQYPSSLATLTLDSGASLPHDIMNGEEYHYKPMGDGTYLLYSVGWDQIDEGGAQAPGPYHYYLDDPDWVWENHPPVGKPK